MKHCRYCGRDMTPCHARAKYCSDDCRDKYYSEHGYPKDAQWSGASFIVRKFICEFIPDNWELINRRFPVSFKVECPNCGEVKLRGLYTILTGKGRFCNNRCRRRYIEAHPGCEEVATCPVCKREHMIALNYDTPYCKSCRKYRYWFPGGYKIEETHRYD